MQHLQKLLKDAGIDYTVTDNQHQDITLDATSYPENRVEKASELINQLKEAGVIIKLRKKMHLVLDWY